MNSDFSNPGPLLLQPMDLSSVDRDSAIANSWKATPRDTLAYANPDVGHLASYMSLCLPLQALQIRGVAAPAIGRSGVDDTEAHDYTRYDYGHGQHEIALDQPMPSMRPSATVVAHISNDAPHCRLVGCRDRPSGRPEPFQASEFHPHCQDIYATPVERDLEAADCRPEAPTAKRARAGSSSATTGVDLSKLDLKLTLGIEGKPYSYAQMITYAIAHAPGGKLTLSDIYDWCTEHFPYFRKQTNTGWKNSIRHNLSLNKSFVKIPRPLHEAGKGAYWALTGESLVSGPVSTSQSRNRQRSQSALEPMSRSPYSKGPAVVAATGRARAGSNASTTRTEAHDPQKYRHSVPMTISHSYQFSNEVAGYPATARESQYTTPPYSPSTTSTLPSPAELPQQHAFEYSAYPDFPSGPFLTLGTDDFPWQHEFQSQVKQEYPPIGFTPMGYPLSSTRFTQLEAQEQHYNLAPALRHVPAWSFGVTQNHVPVSVPNEIPSGYQPPAGRPPVDGQHLTQSFPLSMYDMTGTGFLLQARSRVTIDQ